MKKTNSDKLGIEPIVPLLLRLSIPSILGMAIQALYNVVDSIYIGHLSKEALSALSLAFPIQMLLIAVGAGTGVGTSSLISRMLGRKEEKKATLAAEQAIILSILYGIIFALIGIILSQDIIRLFTDNTLLIKLTNDYIYIILLGSIFTFFPMVSNNILRGEGNTFLPMITLLIGAILNIILDPFLIFGIGFFPALGIKGAAYATVFSKIISSTFMAYILFSSNNQLKLKINNLRFNLNTTINIYKVGFPAMIMQLMGSIMIIFVNKIVVNYSITALAVVGIYFRLESFIFMPVFGLNQGYLPIVGYNYGHKNPDRLKKSIKYGILIASIFTTTGFALFQLFPRELIILFNPDPELLKIGVTALKRISLTYPIIGPAIIASTTFQGIGKGLPSLMLSLLRQLILLIPIMYLLSKYYGLSVLWFAFPISELISSVIILLYFYIALSNILKNMNYLNSLVEK
jgi:putative MATE family efflux protein